MRTVGGSATQRKKLWLWGQLTKLDAQLWCLWWGAVSGKSLTTSEPHFLFYDVKKNKSIGVSRS